MPVPARLSVVTLGVADVARSTAFYRALGWEPSSASTPEVTFISLEGAALGLFGRERPAVLLRAASAAPVEEALLNDIDAMLALDPGKCLSYADARRGISKRVMIEAGQVAGVRLTGETAARDWLKEAITDGLPADAVRRWVLAPVASLPQTGTARGRIVCACENVGEREIEALVSQGAGLEALKDELRCGTGCGSCVPELKAILRNRSKAAA